MVAAVLPETLPGMPPERLAVSPFDNTKFPEKWDVLKLNVTVPVTLVQALAQSSKPLSG